MSVTLTANYKEILSERVVDMIDNLQDELYDLSAMLEFIDCLLYTSPSPRDQRGSRMPSSA